MNSEAHIQQVLLRHWGYSQFRPLQQDIILSVMSGKDTLALMPTGGGKSICFQVPALAMDGLCIVISPLIALMKDQVENLRSRNIPATAVVSGMWKNEIDIALDNCIYGKEKFLYISPERLTSELFLERLKGMKVNLLAVDEAHCISQWGYDFRPSYLRIAEIRELIPDTPVLALTATATSIVEKDIQQKLQFKNANVFRKSFERKNLSYVVLYEEDKLQRMLKVTKNIQGPGIVYVRTRKKAKDVAQFLIANKISAEFYHAGLNSDERSKVQENWMKEKTRVVVSTNAFGMGIDKGNVRFVVHIDAPESLEAYYQEAGRAGRDENKSYAVLLYNQNDRSELEQRAELTFPEFQKIKKTYQALGNFFQLPVGAGQGTCFDFDISAFCNSYDLPIGETFNCLKILELQGLITTTESVELHSRVHFRVKADALYEYQVKNPKYDNFIKTLLRSYESMFEEYISINETQLAVRAGITKEEVVRLLSGLDKHAILAYIPAKDTPQLCFTQERLDQNNLYIDREHLAERKKRYVDRVRSFLHYAETANRCRSQMLVAYFGESDTQRCGVCDYCLGRNKAGVSDLEFDKIHSDVKSMLVKQPLGLHELLEHVKTGNENKALRVIEWLIDNEQIRYAEGNVLEWID
jgi:ATP-dependent DNA helicase RecQ